MDFRDAGEIITTAGRSRSNGGTGVMFHVCLTPKFITIRSYMQQK
jgi:hypothetical protein